MSTKLRDSLSGRGPVPKILLAGAALSAVGLIGAGAASVAGASTTSGHPVTAGTSHSVVAKATTPKTTEPTSGPDTDNIQSGDQTGPDKPGATETKDSAEPTSGPDTDNINVQSGDQNGPDTGQNQ